MFKKILILALVGFLLNVTGVSSAHAGTKQDKEARLAEKVKKGVRKLGTGAEARIEVELRDKTKLKGYVSEAGEDSFVIVDEKTGATSTVAYSQVKQVNGHNLSKATRIAIGLGVIMIPVVIALIYVTSGG